MSEEPEALQELRRRTPGPRPGTRGVILWSSLVTPGAALVFVAAVLLAWPAEVQAGALAVALTSFVLGFRRYFAAVYPQVEAAEPRPAVPERSEEVLEVAPLEPRPILRRALLAAAASLGLAAVVPITSLGPPYRPPVTGWARGVRLVTEEGLPVRPEDLPPSAVAMVWPEGVIRAEHGMAMLTRLVEEPAPPTRAAWVVDGTVVAYSRVCTHTGCAIGILRDRDSILYCPCHQAQFDVRRGAVPVFGPASRPLPQLPLGLGPDGYLVALGDFTEPVGPPRG